MTISDWLKIRQGVAGRITARLAPRCARSHAQTYPQPLWISNKFLFYHRFGCSF
jgi:hypothetical protein